jgi:hypothetical protein
VNQFDKRIGNTKGDIGQIIVATIVAEVVMNHAVNNFANDNNSSAAEFWKAASKVSECRSRRFVSANSDGCICYPMQARTNTNVATIPMSNCPRSWVDGLISKS